MKEKERADRLEAMVDRMVGRIVDKDTQIFELRELLSEVRRKVWFVRKASVNLLSRIDKILLEKQ